MPYAPRPRAGDAAGARRLVRGAPRVIGSCTMHHGRARMRERETEMWLFSMRRARGEGGVLIEKGQ